MKIENNDLGSMPLDMIVVMMKRVLLGGFGDFFNFFKAWAQTKRMSDIVHLLEEFPVRELYPFRLVGTEVDTASFDRFFEIGEGFGISDAILYARCRDIICGVGNLDGHLLELNVLASRGHILSMIVTIIFSMIHRSQYSSTYILENLGRIQDHPYHGSNLGPALKHVQNIKANVSVPENMMALSVQVNVRASCNIHPSGGELSTQGSFAHDCILCNIARMVNVLGSTVDDT